MMKYPFEATAGEVSAAPESFVDAIFSSLASEFLVMPKGEGFLEYSVFTAGYERLKRVTNGFQGFNYQVVLETALACPVILIVLRSMLGFTPPE